MLARTDIKQDIFGAVSTGKLAMWIFVIMDGLTFVTFLIGAVALRYAAATWPAAGTILNIPMTAVNTVVLMASSFTMVLALQALRSNDQKGFRTYLLATIGCGAAFLGAQVWEYVHFLGGYGHVGIFRPSTSLYAATFYAITGLHGIHVLAGLIYLACIARQAFRGRYHAGNTDAVEIVGIFWHFVDLIWVFVFTAIYLI